MTDIVRDIYFRVDSVPSLLTLAKVCWRCSGSGRPLDEIWADDDGLCSGCKGIGMEITDNGEAILALLTLAEKQT